MKPIVQSTVLRRLARELHGLIGRFLTAADDADQRDRRATSVPDGTVVALVRLPSFECVVAPLDDAYVNAWTVESYDADRDTYLLMHATLKTIGGNQAWVRTKRDDFTVEYRR